MAKRKESQHYLIPTRKPSFVGVDDAMLGHIPQVKEIIFEGMVEKLDDRSSWSGRRLALSDCSLSIYFEGDTVIRDYIPVSEVRKD